MVAEKGESGQALEQAKGIAALLAAILEDAGHAGGVPSANELVTLRFDVCGASHRRVLAHVPHFDVRPATLDQAPQSLAIRSCSGREAVGVEDQAVTMQAKAVFKVAVRRLEDVERRLTISLDSVIRLGGELCRRCQRSGNSDELPPVHSCDRANRVARCRAKRLVIVVTLSATPILCPVSRIH